MARTNERQSLTFTLVRGLVERFGKHNPASSFSAVSRSNIEPQCPEYGVLFIDLHAARDYLYQSLQTPVRARDALSRCRVYAGSGAHIFFLSPLAIKSTPRGPPPHRVTGLARVFSGTGRKRSSRDRPFSHSSSSDARVCHRVAIHAIAAGQAPGSASNEAREAKVEEVTRQRNQSLLFFFGRGCRARLSHATGP